MNLSIEQIKASQLAYIKAGGEDDITLQAKYYARPASYRIAWLLMRIGFSANQVTLLALATTIIGGVLLSFNFPFSIIGIIFLLFSHLLDYVDGTIAKATNTISKFGWYLDRTCDEIVETVIPISIGVSLFIKGSNFLGINPTVFLILGFLYAILHLLSVASVNNLRLACGNTTREHFTTLSWWKRLYCIGTNVRSSTIPILAIMFFIPNGLAIFLMAFTALTLCELLLGIGKAVLNR